MIFPDAHLLDDLIVFPQVASRGYEVLLPDLSQAKPEVLNEFWTLWQNQLLQTPDGMRISIQLENIANYHAALDPGCRSVVLHPNSTDTFNYVGGQFCAGEFVGILSQFFTAQNGVKPLDGADPSTGSEIS